MDWIRITGIRAYGYIGALPEEQVLGQWFEVDVAIATDLAQPGQSDRLEDTLNYCQVVETVQRLVQTERFALLERLADEIATALLSPSLISPIEIHSVQVVLTKLTAPIPNFAGRVTVDITRHRTRPLAAVPPSPVPTQGD